MVINRTAKYLFVEVPFSGSTAISHELCESYGGERIIWKHAKLYEADRELGDEADAYFVFGSIRNPLDQAVSEFLKMKNNHHGFFTDESLFARNGGYINDRTLAEYEWIQANDASFDGYFKKFKNKLFNNWYLLGHERFDDIIEFENLAGGFQTALEKIGLDPLRELPVRNPTEGKRRFMEYYPPHTWAQAFRCYGPFMARWGYAFPTEWGTPRIPPGATMRFRTVERSVQRVTRHVKLDSASSVVQRLKRIAQGG